MHNKSNYEDIINLPHPTSSKHPRMSMSNRAAQFAPFAALTGHSAALEETARYTDTKPELTDEEKEIINNKLLLIISLPHPIVKITYFKPDQRKQGGEYITITDEIIKIDEQTGQVVTKNKFEINISDIVTLGK